MHVHIFWLVPAAVAGAAVNCLILFTLAWLQSRYRRSDTYIYNIETQHWEKA